MIPKALRDTRALEQYELIRALERGPVGPVFLARDIRLGRLVAIKFLDHGKRALTEEFLAEARATAGCRHESILDIHDVGEVDGQAYMVLAYVPGPTLRSWLRRRERSGRARRSMSRGRGRLSVSGARAVKLLAPVIDALVHAHASDIVHGNLTPKNIVLADAGGVKVRDFGIGELLGDDSGFVNSFPYRAPEQCNGEPAEPRSDLWAVGIMLFELITGAHPLAPAGPERLQTIGDLDHPMPRLEDSQPQLGALATAIDRCLCKRLSERMPSAAALAEALGALRPDRTLELAADTSPFAGLAAFQVTDAGRFFGRDRDIAAVTTRLRREPVLTVAGPSGAGKSSFIRAGVIPALQRLDEGWRACIVRPGRKPLHSLAASVTDSPAVAGDRADDDRDVGLFGEVDELVSTWRSLPGQLGTLLRARCRRRGWRLVLFVDQFEQLYTLCADPEDRAVFLACLEGVGDDESSPLRVILSVRSDFLDQMATRTDSGADEKATLSSRVPTTANRPGGLLQSLVFLPPMGQDGLRSALTRPLLHAGYEFESDTMVEDMLATLATTRCPLPLLQFTAAELWEDRDENSKLLTRASYRRLGGVEGALVTHADAVLAGLSARDRRLARAVFLRLVTPERTRALVSLTELRELSDESDAVEHVVRHLASAPLILMESGTERQGVTVELIHESLIDRWPQFAQWLDEIQDNAQFTARLRAAAAQWQAQGRAQGLLWRGRAAEDAEDWWQTANRAEISADEERYVRAVIDLTQRARRRRRGILGSAFAFLGLVALIVSYLAVQASHEAARAERLAARADREAAVVRAHKDEVAFSAVRARNATRMATAREHHSDPTTVLALVREVEPGHMPRGWSVLARWALQSDVAQVVLAHPDVIRWAAFSPDGTRIATASWDRRARVWNADGSGRPIVLEGHDDRLSSVHFSPDGTRIATSSLDQTARVWNADGSGRPVVLRGHRDRVWSAAFSPDGTRVLTASSDGHALIWGIDGSGPLITLSGHENGVSSAAFSPDGTRVATSSLDRTARIHRADGLGRARVLRGHTERVYSVRFGPDSARVVTSSADRTARVWNIADNGDGDGGARPPVVLSGHADRVYTAAFSPNGRRIVTASSDKTIRIWNADGSGPSRIVRAHQDRVYWATFSPDGSKIVSASSDRTARVWNTDRTSQPIVLRGHDDFVYLATLSEDGSLAATASADGTARVWTVAHTRPPLVLTGHKERVYSVAFDRPAGRVVTASGDQTARIWSLVDPEAAPLVLQGHEGIVFGAIFSPDGTRVATAGEDHTARVWAAAGDRAPVLLRGHEGPVYSVDFSPDGTRIVTASADRKARLWNADGSGRSTVLHGHDDRVYSAAFSPDGRRVVTASADKTARIWRADGTGAPIVLRGHRAQVGVGGGRPFSPDGKRLVTNSKDETIRVWNTDGTGRTLVMGGLDYGVNSASFSADGTRIIAGSEDGAARIWTDIEPLRGIADDKLWSATSYCLSVERRERLLDVTTASARAAQWACERRVHAR